MILRFLNFLMLFAYINIIAHEPGLVTASDGRHLLENDSLVAYIMNNLLETPVNSELGETGIVNDNYQLAKAISYTFAVILFLITLLFLRQKGKIMRSSHPFYRTKSFCLQACYSYLFRLKPF